MVCKLISYCDLIEQSIEEEDAESNKRAILFDHIHNIQDVENRTSLIKCFLVFFSRLALFLAFATSCSTSLAAAWASAKASC